MTVIYWSFILLLWITPFISFAEFSFFFCYLFLRVLNILRFIIIVFVYFTRAVGRILDGPMTFALGVASVFCFYTGKDSVDAIWVTIQLTLR